MKRGEFDVGLHFSLRELWAVCDTVLWGALVQLVVITGLGLLLAQLWGWPPGSCLAWHSPLPAPSS